MAVGTSKSTRYMFFACSSLAAVALFVLMITVGRVRNGEEDIGEYVLGDRRVSEPFVVHFNPKEYLQQGGPSGCTQPFVDVRTKVSPQYNVRHPLNDLSSEEFVLGVQSDKEISMTGSTPKTNSSELRFRLLKGCLTLYKPPHIKTQLSN